MGLSVSLVFVTVFFFDVFGYTFNLQFGVADVKWSREATVQHYAQVAYYTVLLEEICRAEGIEASVETRWGWLWTRGSRGCNAGGRTRTASQRCTR